MCIRVSSRRSIYITDGFIVTHNTASAICGLTRPETWPALIVTMPHLLTQWRDEIGRFAPQVLTDILKGPTRPLTGAHVYIISYSKLAAFEPALNGIKSIIFDEVQELRGEKSKRAATAKRIAAACEYRLGLSATPIHNYADEFHRVFEAIKPGALGGPRSFYARHCVKRLGKIMFRSPEGFGNSLRDAGLLLRRTRADVHRELPPINHVEYRIDADAALYESLLGDAPALAEIILAEDSDKKARWRAAERLPNILRQATGMAKSKYVSDFVKMLLESRKNVVLFGWHRAVIEKWQEELKDYGAVLYSGSENAKKKAEAKVKFLSGEARVLILSLRSGVGLDGLQHICDTAVFGELDWTRSIHEQCVGRVARDGQKNSTDAFYLTTNIGADPSIMQNLDLKSICLDGVINPGKHPHKPVSDQNKIKSLAADFLASRAQEKE